MEVAAGTLHLGIDAASRGRIRELFLSIPVLTNSLKINNRAFPSFRRKPESRAPGENRDAVLEMVPDFRRDDVWTPAPAPDPIRGSPG